MKYVLALVVLLTLCVNLCRTRQIEKTVQQQPASNELVVFAAASMTETLTRVAELYQKEAPSIRLFFNFDSSGTLKTQIQEGAECDVFISAGQRQMDQLDKNASPTINTEKLDCIQPGTRIDLLENKVTLCVPEGNPANITAFANLAEQFTRDDFLFAMGNSDVPVGQYTQMIFAFFNLDEQSLARAGKITYGSNVKEVTTQIAEASVSCGVVYCTDAYSAGLAIADYAAGEMCGRIIYPAAVLKNSKNPGAAKAFMEFLQSPAATAIFEKAGFSAVR